MPKISQFSFIVSFVLAWFVAGHQWAYAGPIIDQQNDVEAFGGTNIGDSTLWGQSFTPTLDAIDFFQFRIGAANGSAGSSGSGATFEVQLFNGIIGSPPGDAIATSLPVNLPPGFATFPTNGAMVQFDFSETVDLIPETLYIAQLVKLSGDTAFNIWQGPSTNLYTRGSHVFRFDSGSNFLGSANSDFIFAEGINEQAVPEPSTFALLICGLVGTGAIFRRKKR
ncbi:MAG: PEP-CTERM sorting domain-containing protein [Planctomycetota bacterium]|nr:PEP-CTERM sorting domain-containing protein [Planctomycetota bacterium]MDA1211527.1 PEP-CTERM sorting domain-containing protein [Planctomycetota bacterium]